MSNVGLIEVLIILVVCVLTLAIMGGLFYFLYRLLRASNRAAPQMKDCSNCGRGNLADAVYCSYCGQELTAPPAENPVP